jgi:thiol-disulfide isomerase/thioredoxin
MNLRRGSGAVIALLSAAVVAGCGQATTPPDASASQSMSEPSAASPGPSIVGVPPCPASDPSVAAVESGLPDLTLPCLTLGPQVRLAGLRGTPTVLNVWASWCAPCREELPLLVDLAERTRSDELLVVGVDLLDRTDPALAIVEDFGLNFPSVVDADGALRAELGLQAPPVTYFVDADGVIVRTKVGAFVSQTELDAAVVDALGVDL